MSRLRDKYLQVIGPQARITDKSVSGKITEDEAEKLINEARLRLDDEDWQVIRDFEAQCKRDVYWGTKKGLIQPSKPYTNPLATL